MRSSSFDSIEDALQAIADGELVVVLDDADRENEGDLIMAASKASIEKVAFMIRHTSGILCVPVSTERAKKLQLNPMVHDNNAPLNTAFTVSVDYRHGLTTGISAKERTNTILALADKAATASDFVRPGHLFPLIARDGGVLFRSGHTEAAIDLTRLAGCPPVGLLAEIVNDDGTVKKTKQLIEFASENNLITITIDDLIAYRQKREKLVKRIDQLTIDTSIGKAQALIYKTSFDECQHIALIFGEPDLDSPVIVRIHRERVLDDLFGSQSGRSSNLINAALAAIQKEGQGIFLYLRHTDYPEAPAVEKSEASGQAMWKEVGLGAQILKDLGIQSIRLLSGQHHNYVGLSGFEIELVGSETLG